MTAGMEPRWIIAIATGSLVMTTLIIALIIHSNFHAVVCPDEACQSTPCINAASQILKYIDTEQDPCDNFYNFVCGNFMNSVDISDDQYEINENTILVDNIHRQLHEAFELPIELNETKTFKLVKNYYKSCMNTDAIEKLDLEIFNHLLLSVGGWPVLEDHTWEVRNLEWYHYLYKFRQHGLDFNHFFSLVVQHDFKNSSHYILQISHPKFTLPEEILLDEEQNEYIEAYFRYMFNVAVYLGADEFKASKELTEVLSFEKKLAAITKTTENYTSIDTIYNIRSIEDLHKEYPSIPWLEYINNMIVPHVNVTTHERILDFSPNYFSKLEELLKETPKRAQINYLVWKTVEEMVPYLIDDLRSMEFKFKSTSLGIIERKPRWKECVEETYARLPIAVSSYYVRNFFDDGDKLGVEKIIRTIKLVYGDTVGRLSWMDNKSKQAAREKVEALTETLAYPDELLEDGKLEELYEEVNVNPKEYLQSFLSISSTRDNMKFKNLRLMKSKTAWLDIGTLSLIDAVYYPLRNAIIIPYGVLQGFYFDKEYPNYLNYAGIGYAISHEISHAFDSTGELFDKDGNMNSLMTKHSKKTYLEKIECITSQYSEYNISQINEMVNEIKTLNENIADNAGVRYAYNAYLNVTKKYGDDKKLPGMPYTTRQLFWISYAIKFCSKQRSQFLRKDYFENEHSFPEFRVNGPLSNMEDFAYDFGCLDETDMYGVDRCIVW